VDADQVPLKNPLDLILANREIIGLPTPIANNGFIVWNVFMNSKDVEGKYVPLMLHGGMLDDKKYPDLVECHAVGGGCLIIKREVFEKVYPPFLDKIDSDGGMEIEHDLEFCRKSREAGYHVFFSPYYRCEHIKLMPLLEILGSHNKLLVQEELQNG
jgi:GT2 family glycosyltransferase